MASVESQARQKLGELTRATPPLLEQACFHLLLSPLTPPSLLSRFCLSTEIRSALEADETLMSSAGITALASLAALPDMSSASGQPTDDNGQVVDQVSDARACGDLTRTAQQGRRACSH